jgi:hypothetical protein
MPFFLVETLDRVVDRELHPLRFLRSLRPRHMRERGLHGTLGLAPGVALFARFTLLVIECSLDVRFRLAWHW